MVFSYLPLIHFATAIITFEKNFLHRHETLIDCFEWGIVIVCFTVVITLWYFWGHLDDIMLHYGYPYDGGIDDFIVKRLAEIRLQVPV